MRTFLPNKLRSDTGGTAAVEFALIAPVLGAALVAMVDLGMGFYENMEVENAAQAGAEYAITQGWNANAVANAVTAAGTLAAISATPAPTQSCGCASGTTITATACGTACPNGASAGTYVTVNAQAQYTTIFSYPGLTSPMTLSAQSVVRINEVGFDDLMRRLLADRRGASAIELGLVLPVLMLMLLGIVETGRVIWTQSVLHYAVEHAARCAAVDVNNCATTAQVQNYAVGLAAPVAVTAADFTVTTPACGAQVVAAYPFQTVVANLLPYTITLSAQSCFPR